MDAESINARFQLAQEVIQEAGQLALTFHADLSSLTIRHKGPQDLVSEADQQVEEHIRQRIVAAFPEDGFVGEETGSADGREAVWIVDPIDGTQDFLLGFPTWCVSIALVTGEQMQFGLITSPTTGDTDSARSGAGAHLNGRPIHAATASSLSQGVTGVGYSQHTSTADLTTIMTRLAEGGGNFRCVGSGALMIVWVATGQCLGYVETHINAWDCMAALCIVKEAGGRTSPFLSEFGPNGGGRVVAAAPLLYEAMESLLP